MSNGRVRVFLDANVLAKPVTRTLILLAAEDSAYVAIWSQYAETEASGHLGGRRAPLAAVRAKLGMDLEPTGSRPDVFGATSYSDRQILADAAAARAHFIITEDVDDFGEEDLAEVAVAAVHPDLFLAERCDRQAYVAALKAMSSGMTSPARSPEQIHVNLGRQHPRMVAAHAEVFDVEPAPPTHNPPAVIFRGTRCLRCLAIGKRLTDGVCFGCREAKPGRAA